MKTIILFLLFGLIFTFGGCNSDKSKTSDNKILIGTIDSLHSKILNEERKIWVYVPYSNPGNAKQNYPVVYLLDGDKHFYSVMGMIQQLSEVNGNMVLPQMILIGIPNTDRTRDLTPSHNSTQMIDSTSGGGEVFTSFIEKELIPYVDSLYPTTKYRVLIGHSFGGLTAINILVNHTKLFNSYIAIDPSMWWDKQKLLKQVMNVVKEKDFTGNSLYLAIANSANVNLNFSKAKNDTSKNNPYREGFELVNSLEANKQNNLNFSWKYYKDDDHPSVPLIAEYDGLRFIFDFYELKINGDQIMKSNFNIDSLISKYSDNLSKRLGYNTNPPRRIISSLGYDFLNSKQYDKALRLFEMNVKNYPTSAYVYDSKAELLMLKGDTTASIYNYEKSLSLYPGNKNAKDMIAKMKKLKK